MAIRIKDNKFESKFQLSQYDHEYHLVFYWWYLDLAQPYCLWFAIFYYYNWHSIWKTTLEISNIGTKPIW